MKVSVTDLSPCKRSVSVDVPPDVVAAEYEKTCRDYARKIRIDGFRQGKIPRHLVEQRFGREIEQEVVEHLIHDCSADALEEAGLRPLQSPVLKDYRFDRAKGLSFVTEFEVRPKVTASNYRGLKVRRETVDVKEMDVNAALESLRDRHARYEAVEDRGVEAGDWVVLDAEGSFEAGKGEPFSNKDAFFEIGSNGPHPEFTDDLRGARPGEERVFGVNYPADHPASEIAGRRVVYKVRVKEVKRKHLPDLDDEFAKAAGPFESLQALRERVSQDLASAARERERGEARRQILDQMVDAHESLEVPEALVEDQIEGYIEDVMRSMMARGIDPREARVDWEEMRRQQREPAARSVRAMLLLDSIAEQEKILVEESEVSAALDHEASRRRQSAAALRAKWEKEDRLDALKRQILREKVLDFLLGSANT